MSLSLAGLRRSSKRRRGSSSSDEDFFRGSGFDWSLTILNAQEADEGIYECQVRTRSHLTYVYYACGVMSGDT